MAKSLAAPDAPAITTMHTPTAGLSNRAEEHLVAYPPEYVLQSAQTLIDVDNRDAADSSLESTTTKNLTQMDRL